MVRVPVRVLKGPLAGCVVRIAERAARQWIADGIAEPIGGASASPIESAAFGGAPETMVHDHARLLRNR